MPYSSGAGQESYHSSLSRGSGYQRAHTDGTTFSLGVKGSSSSVSTLCSEQGLVASQRPSTNTTAKSLSSARVAPPNGSAACSIPYTTSAQQLASLTSFLQPACPQPTGYRYAPSSSSSSTGHNHVSDNQTESWSNGFQPEVPLSAVQPVSSSQELQPAARLSHAGYPVVNTDRQHSQGCSYQSMMIQAQHQSGSQCPCSYTALPSADGSGSVQAMQRHPSRLADLDHLLFKPAPQQLTGHNHLAIWSTSWQQAGQQTLAAGREASAASETSAAEVRPNPAAAETQHCSLVEYFKPEEVLPHVQSHSSRQPSSMLRHPSLAYADQGSSSLPQPSQQPALQLKPQRREHSETQVLPRNIAPPVQQIMSRAKEPSAFRAVLQQPVAAEQIARPGLLDLPTVERVRCPRSNMRRYIPRRCCKIYWCLLQ